MARFLGTHVIAGVPTWFEGHTSGLVRIDPSRTVNTAKELTTKIWHIECGRLIAVTVGDAYDSK
jgi:hypothetical protein